MFFEIVGVVEQEQFVERFVYDKAVKMDERTIELLR
jgi:hypothetical protein